MSLLPVDEAKSRILDGISAIEDVELIALAQAQGRILARDLHANLTQPPFRGSAMDGYAVIAEDVAKVKNRLRVVGVAAAGHSFDGTVHKGEAVRIFTGAPVPEGADTVLLQEDARVLDGGWIENQFSPEKGRHIRPEGQDFTHGEALLNRGDRLDFSRLMLAAGANHASVPVFRKPRVGLIATGDELVSVGDNPNSNQIIASSTFGIAALARSAGAEIVDLGIVPDKKEAIQDAVRRGQQASVDILVTLGGASVGDHDLVQSTLRDMGMSLDFWKIAMRPGKPLMVGNLGSIKVLGLPGNPVSSMVCGILFLEPLVAKLAYNRSRFVTQYAISLSELNANDQRQDYLRAKLHRLGDGSLAAESYGKQDSSQMKIFARSDALIVRPPHAPMLTKGDRCEIIVLRQPD